MGAASKHGEDLEEGGGKSYLVTHAQLCSPVAVGTTNVISRHLSGPFCQCLLHSRGRE